MDADYADSLGILIGIFVAVWIIDNIYEGGSCDGEDEDENWEDF